MHSEGVQHLVIIDGHHLMYRAFYAIPQTLKTTKGEQTNAVYGVASMLLTLLKVEEPTHLLFCFDAGEETFRHQENATYKEGRAETPDSFYLQIPRILAMIDAFGLQHVSDVHFEADDFLCAYAREGERAGMRVSIVTGDRDALQLATQQVRIAIPHKGYQQTEYLGPAEVLAKYGVRPDQIPSYKGIVGDASDNLPGVHGIGPKTAATLLQSYDTLTGVYEHLSEIKPTVRAKLEKDKDQAFFCERMATLVSMTLPLPLEALCLERQPVSPVHEFFRALEFGSLSKRFDALVSTPFGQAHFLHEASPVTSEKTISPASQLSLF